MTRKAIIRKEPFSSDGTPTNKKQYFLIWCIEALKRHKNISGSIIYNKLAGCGCLQFIMECYDALHTQGEEVIVDDIELFCRRRGVVF